ncbi:MAG TPA: hypothetical protein VMR45_01675 [Patescibacteria group bacterium]|nr:hypothetical protein [Patescibacteria group bacterium]
MSLQFFKQKSFYWFYGAGLILLVVAGFAGCIHYNNNPERVFWGMISQSMKTSGATVQASQISGTSTYKQTTQFSFGGQNYTHTLVNLTQPGTTVQDEMIGTPKADYSRYASIKSDKKNSAGKTIDFSKVVGVWAKTDNTSTGSQLMTQSVLGTGLPLGGIAVPIADLSPKLASQLYKQIRNDNVYQVSFKNIKKSHDHGRLRYAYTVTMKAKQYAAMMKSFAQSVGMHDLDSLSPNDYASQPAVELTMTVDVQSRQLVSAEAVSAGIKQTYSGYNIPVVVNIPKKTVTSTELQKRLQSL